MRGLSLICSLFTRLAARCWTWSWSVGPWPLFSAENDKELWFLLWMEWGLWVNYPVSKCPRQAATGRWNHYKAPAHYKDRQQLRTVQPRELRCTLINSAERRITRSISQIMQKNPGGTCCMESKQSTRLWSSTTMLAVLGGRISPRWWSEVSLHPFFCVLTVLLY